MMRMKRTSQLFLLTFAFGLLSACSSTKRLAPVVERNPAAETRTPAVTEQPKDERFYYTVKRGDTLLGIALDYGQNYRELAAWNGLSNPNDIRVDQVLRVAPPDQVAGVQTMPVPMPPSDTRPAPVVPTRSRTPTPRWLKRTKTRTEAANPMSNRRTSLTGRKRPTRRTSPTRRPWR